MESLITGNIYTNKFKAKKICFIIMDITLKGGIERVTCNLSNQFVGDYTVEIMSFFRSYPKIQYDLNPEISITYLSNYKFRYRTYKLLLFKILINKYSYFSNKTSTKYIGLYPIINIILIFFARLRYDGLIAVEHSEYYSQSWLLRKLRAFAYGKINQIVVLTQSGKICFEKIGIPVRVIPNAVTDFENSKQWTAKERDCGPLQCLFAGRFEPVKQIDHVINLAKKIANDNIRNVHFNFLGEGPLFPSIVSLAEKENLNNITFWGNVKHIDRHYGENQILLITSKTEAFPMVVIEAMSFGCVVIGYDSQVGTKEIIENGKSGFIVPENDVNSIAEIIYLLSNDPEKLASISSNATRRACDYRSVVLREDWKNLFS